MTPVIYSDPEQYRLAVQLWQSNRELFERREDERLASLNKQCNDFSSEGPLGCLVSLLLGGGWYVGAHYASTVGAFLVPVLGNWGANGWVVGFVVYGVGCLILVLCTEGISRWRHRDEFVRRTFSEPEPVFVPRVAGPEPERPQYAPPPPFNPFPDTGGVWKSQPNNIHMAMRQERQPDGTKKNIFSWNPLDTNVLRELPEGVEARVIQQPPPRGFAFEYRTSPPPSPPPKPEVNQITSLRQAIEILGLPPKTTTSQAKARFRELMAQYHPDKVAHLGPELRELAAKKALQINLAYQFITKKNP
jgi:DnaJ-domain-containing protein 1